MFKPASETIGLRAMRRGRSWKKKGRVWPWLRRGFLVLFLVAVAPLLLTLVYAFTPVHPLSTLMVKDLVTFQGYDRRWITLQEVEPRLVHSVMMSEDGQFCNHRGIDMGELRVIVESALQGEQTRGGSTITMQTVKNLYLWHGRSYVRKAIEIPLAVYVDAVMDKDRIMEIYLNIAEWGPNIYGIEAAAQHHFGRSARDLTSQQAALLAVTLPNPRGRNPARPTPNLQRIAGIIEARARAAGGYVQCLPR